MSAARPGAVVPHRILVAKPGLDGTTAARRSWRGRSGMAGFEVIYTGLRKTPEQIVAAAVQEDVRAVGLSILSGAHNTLLPEVVEGLRAADAGDVLVFAGGIVPDRDIENLKTAGVDEVFPPGLEHDRDHRVPEPVPGVAMTPQVDGEPSRDRPFGAGD